MKLIRFKLAVLAFGLLSLTMPAQADLKNPLNPEILIPEIWLKSISQVCNTVLHGKIAGSGIPLNPDAMNIILIFARGAQDGLLEEKVEGMQFLKLSAELIEQNRFLPALINVMQVVRDSMPPTKNLPHSDETIATMLFHAIRSEVMSRGMLPSAGNTAFKSVAEIENSWKDRLSEMNPTHELGSMIFWEDVKSLTGANVRLFNQIEALETASASNKKRFELMDRAQKSLDFLMWGWYDDAVGTAYADQLIQELNKKPELVVRIVVDQWVAKRNGYHANLDRLSKVPRIHVKYADIGKIIQDQKFPYFGMHQKFQIRDGRENHKQITPEVIMGGRNIGIKYLGDDLDPATWSDTDVHVKGPVVVDAVQNFVDVYNTLLAAGEAPLVYVPRRDLTSGDVTAMLLNSHPNQTEANSIVPAELLTIRLARTELLIENAYFLPTPMMDAEIEGAIRRGVKVKILTNSVESIDEAVISVPIAMALRRYLRMGCEVNLKQGSTDHNKKMLADRKIGFIGSQNLHPRSIAYETESMLMVGSTKNKPHPLLAGMLKSFEDAKQVFDEKDLQIKHESLWTFMNDLFYWQL
jgi:phosphatidylserine/phosphatidylglycerophosphate/cardiolipin synthase-like enzyme